MNYFTYILFSEKTGKFYIGSTGNIENRLARHNAGATKSTKMGRPWEIAYFEQYDNKPDAVKRELYLKSMKSKTYIQALIKNSPTG